MRTPCAVVIAVTLLLGTTGRSPWNLVDGEGAYEGLTAVFRFVAEEGYEGVIVPGGLPSFPAAAE